MHTNGWSAHGLTTTARFAVAPPTSPLRSTCDSDVIETALCSEITTSEQCAWRWVASERIAQHSIAMAHGGSPWDMPGILEREYTFDYAMPTSSQTSMYDMVDQFVFSTRSRLFAQVTADAEVQREYSMYRVSDASQVLQDSRVMFRIKHCSSREYPSRRMVHFTASVVVYIPSQQSRPRIW